jgi:hypothetical protein
MQGIAAMYVQCHGQSHGIQSAKPVGIAVVLEQSLGLSVMMICYRNDGQHGRGHITQKVIPEGGGIGWTQRPHSDPSGKHRVHFDSGQARNDYAPLRLVEERFNTGGSRFRLVQLGESARIEKVASHSESVLTLGDDIGGQRAGDL